MCKFKPFNKHILVEKFPQKKKEDTSPVLIPEGAKIGEEERYGLVKFVCSASDCESSLVRLNPDQTAWATQTGTSEDIFTSSARNSDVISLVVESSQIEQVTIKDKKYHIVHQRHIIGILDE
jgi:hypothetical protein